MRKAQKVEGLWFPLPASLSLHGRKTTETNEPSFLTMQFQSKLAHSLVQQSQELFSIFALFKTHHEIIGIPHEENFSPGMVPTPMMSPRYPYYYPRVVKVAGADRLVGCQDVFCRVVFQLVGVNSATRVIGQSPRRGNTSLK